jgi:hypothetical protein
MDQTLLSSGANPREQKEEEMLLSPMKHAWPGRKALGASAFSATLRGFSPGIVRQGH